MLALLGNAQERVPVLPLPLHFPLIAARVVKCFAAIFQKTLVAWKLLRALL